jgi:hypothetical protein
MPYPATKKKQGTYYSGKKKRHTIKVQAIIDEITKGIIAIYTARGKKHEMRVFDESKTRFREDIHFTTDKGYVGLKKIHANTSMPKKKPKGKSLSKEEKKINRAISSRRMPNEHVFGILKRFDILASPYRNRRKRFALRFSLIAGIYNYELFYQL